MIDINLVDNLLIDVALIATLAAKRNGHVFSSVADNSIHGASPIEGRAKR